MIRFLEIFSCGAIFAIILQKVHNPCHTGWKKLRNPFVTNAGIAFILRGEFWEAACRRLCADRIRWMGDDKMKRAAERKWLGQAAGAAFLLGAVLCTAPVAGVSAEETAENLYQEEAAESFYQEEAAVFEEGGFGEDISLNVTEDSAGAQTGDYTVGAEWVLAEEAGDGEKWIYKKSGSEGLEDTSTLTCSYVDTNFSVLEYEQLRDMLTNNLVYSNVEAQVSTSALYTDAKDYLFILISDDAAQDFRSLYYYVVGDRRCFCVEVKEYRAEADSMRAAKQETPEEAGKKIAQTFTWNVAG